MNTAAEQYQKELRHSLTQFGLKAAIGHGADTCEFLAVFIDETLEALAKAQEQSHE